MSHRYYLSPIAISLTMAITTPATAAERISLNRTSLTALQQLIHTALPNAPQTTATHKNALQFISQHTDKKDITHTRMQQTYAGFPVFGGYAILHHANQAKSVLQTNANIALNGAIYRGLQTDLGQASPSFVTHAQIALQRFKAQYQNQTISEERVTPMVYIDEQQRAFWAYKVSVLLQPEDKIPARPTAIVDAQTYLPFVAWDDVKTARSVVNGQGFGGNKRTGEYQFGKQRPLLEITRDHFSDRCYMENKRVKVVDMNYRYTKTNTPMEFDCPLDKNLGDNTYWTGYLSDGYDRKNEGYSPSNDALYIGDVIHTMYRVWYESDALTDRQKPMQLVMRVHYGKSYENAFWDGKQMTFGDGDLMTYPLVSLTVGAHEISHGFTEQHANLDYFGQSGGMNESFSDMAAQAAEYYAEGKSSWQIGAEILKEESGYTALRFMDKPSRDGHSIDSADKYRQGMDVHYSSGVYNHLFYLLANQPGWNPRKAFHVMLKANMDYWTPESSFDEGACGVINAAHDLDLSVDDVKQSLDAVQISYEDCE